MKPLPSIRAMRRARGWKKKRLREGGVGPEMRSPAGLGGGILPKAIVAVNSNPQSRVITYIDGFNLYFGLRSKGWRKYYWLDVVRLSKALLKPNQRLAEVHYFTSRICTNGYNAEDIRRQDLYLEALTTLRNLTLHFGHYLDKSRRCRACGTQWKEYEEKMTDVNIAVQLLTDAFEDRFDVALLISADSDLTTPVRQVLSQFEGKRIVIARPPGRNSVSLCRIASGYFTIGEAKLRSAQLPAQVTRADGFVLTRPLHWR